MKEYFKNMTLAGRLGVIGGIVGIVNAILYAAYSIAVGLFAPIVFVMLLLGIAGSIFAAFSDLKFAPILPVLFYSLAFGLYISDRIIMFEEMINKIYGMNERGAILPIVIVIFVLCFVSIVTSIIASFNDRKKELPLK
ncbi:MAG: hypothetical protein J6D37_05450 [Clostridia bacterium]|nr:hypothetical protein [Clostridia bacterium]